MKLLVTICLAIFGVACEHATDLKKETAGREVHFKIHTSPLTRSGKEAFAVGDSIGIYAVKRAEHGNPAIPARTGNQAHNAKWIKTEEGWQPASPFDKVLWSLDDSPLDFYAYYPYKKAAFDPTAINVGVNLNQSSEQGSNESDILRAANIRGLVEGEVELQFEHVFSLVEIGLTGDKVALSSPSNVFVNEVVTSGLLDLGTGQVSPLETGKVVPYCVNPDQSLYRVILPSQNVEKGLAFLQCEWDGSSYIYRSPGMELEAACLQRFEIEVK